MPNEGPPTETAHSSVPESSITRIYEALCHRPRRITVESMVFFMQAAARPDTTSRTMRMKTSIIATSVVVIVLPHLL